MEDDTGEPSRKRQRLSQDANEEEYIYQADRRKLIHESLNKPVSPPPLRRGGPILTEVSMKETIESPFQLIRIRDLPAAANVDTVSLKDILGDPLISECWDFNYLHNMDFLMDAFDEDIRGLVKLHVVHGFWKQENQSRLNLIEQAKRYPNITLHTAYMPEMFGTHHSKMLILFRHDDTAQVIIHTANMIPFDWINMTQAVWRSPLLPKRVPAAPHSNQVGSGSKFKTDLVNYLKAYDTKRTICKPLVEQLFKHDFSKVRAALVASVPGKQSIEADTQTSWGWPGLKNVLQHVPTKDGESEIIVQISSIATLGVNDKWLDQTLFKTMRTSKNPTTSKPKFRIVFPTADEIRRSLNGYQSGSAIHTKIQSAAQVKQLQYLKPLLCHWAGDGAQHSPHASSSTPVLDAGRKRAAPHIKTFIRFADGKKTSIDWMLVTSANLSKQAWGEGVNAAGDVRICSYEIGVIVWPELYGDNATMVPTFGTDTPTPVRTDGGIVIGARMPYDIPLVPYANGDVPWCATASYNEPDWTGETWNVG